MADQGDHGISWTGVTWSPITGCTRVSPGCEHCYSERLSAGRLAHLDRYAGTTRNGRWTGQVNLHPDLLDLPLTWRKPRMIFVCSMSDLFHKAVPDEFLAAVWATMAATPRHCYQLLTKRPERLQEFDRWMPPIAPGRGVYPALPVEQFAASPLANVWLGTSVEDQPRADKRIPCLLQTPATVRWLSVEPMLGPVDLEGFRLGGTVRGFAALDWVVCGGESGPGARPMKLTWARDLRDQCTEAGVAFWMKQMGSVWARENKSRWPDGKLDSHGSCMENWPPDLRVRQWPAGFVPPNTRNE